LVFGAVLLVSFVGLVSCFAVQFVPFYLAVLFGFVVFARVAVLGYFLVLWGAVCWLSFWWLSLTHHSSGTGDK
jgi:hypothetical protein